MGMYSGANAGKLLIDYYGPYPGDRIVCITEDTYDDDKWHHVGFARTGAASMLVIIDGEDVTSGCTGTSGGNANMYNANNLFIGDYTSGGAGWRGELDEFRIYNRTLTQSEIQNLYELGSYHIDWNDWISNGTLEDNISVSVGESKFMQYRYNFSSNDTYVSAYVLNETITKYQVW